MAIESVITEATPAQAYPVLKVYKQHMRVVLFSSPRVGTVVYAGSGDKHVGWFLRTWCEDAYVTFDGNLLLSNTNLCV